MADTEKRFVLGLGYQAGPDPRIRKGQDGGRDFFTAEQLETAAWKFLTKRAAGMFHLEGTDGHIEIVESYIYRGPDWDVGEGLVIKAGDWVVGGVLDELAWRLYKTGRITGWSPQGQGRRIAPGSEP